MENTVEMNMQGVLDDAALMPMQEAEPLSDLNEVAEPAQETETVPANEPGWLKKRLDKVYQKAAQETEARLRTEFEAIIAPLRQAELERQADALVSSGEFKTKERAVEYLQLKGGFSATPNATPNATDVPRDAQGRFAPKDTENRVRANMLAQQANKIQQNRGLDVMAIFNANPEIQQQVLSGNMDFYDVADYATQRRVPAPMRSTNGAGVNKVNISTMTDEQFARLNENLAKGIIYDAR